jgi:hypothetical protein
MAGELLRCRTSIGKATVDILVPSIDIDEPNINSRKAGELDSKTRTVRDLAINAFAARVRKSGKSFSSRPARASEAVFLRSSVVVSRIGAKIPSLASRFSLWCTQSETTLRAAANIAGGIYSAAGPQIPESVQYGRPVSDWYQFVQFLRRLRQ